MKVLFVILLALNIGLIAQTTVKTFPQPHSVVNVYNDTLKGAAVNTSAISTREWTGNITVFIYMDTTDSGTPSALAIKGQYYNPLTSQWHDDYTNNAAFSPGAALWAEKYTYVKWNQFTDQTWGDSLRFVLTPNSSDTGLVRIDIGGQ